MEQGRREQERLETGHHAWPWYLVAFILLTAPVWLAWSVVFGLWEAIQLWRLR